MTIILLLISGVVDSLAGTLAKKSMNQSNMPSSLFKLFSSFSGIAFIPIMLLIFGFDAFLLSNFLDLFFIGLIMFGRGLHVYTDLHIMRNTKVSELLPYSNLDKLFIIITSFIIFYGTTQSASLTTLIISLLTLVVMFFGNVDIKNIQVPKMLGWILVDRLISASTFIALGYFLVQYSPVTIVTMNWVFQTIFLITAGLILRDNFKSLLTQKKEFYQTRIGGSSLGWCGNLLGLFILSQTGIIVATLLGFMGIVFKVISMKLILQDSPSKRQVITAIIVTILIGIGYYFK